MIDWDTFKKQVQTRPERSLRSVLLLAGTLLLIWILFVVQTGPITQNNVQVGPTGHLSSFNIDSLTVKDSIAVSPAQHKTPALLKSDSNKGSFSWLPAVVVLIVIVGGAWFLIRTKRKKQNDGTKEQIYTPIATQQLPGGQQLMAVKLNNEYWIMSVGGREGVKLLHRYSQEEWSGIEKTPAKDTWKETLLATMNSTELKKN